MSAQVLAVANQKGGVGKTTTAVNLAASLAVAERRVLLVDLDPQGNASSAFGVEPGDDEATVYEALLGERPPGEVLRDTELPGLRLLPSNRHLIGAEIELIERPRREARLRELLAGLREDFDEILVDCPPSLGLLTINALVAADAVLVPLQCEYYALEGLSSLMGTISLVRESLNPGLRLEGILLTMFDPRNKLSHQVASEARQFFDAEVFETAIPRNVRLSESPSFGKPALLYDVTCKGTTAYLETAEELMRRRAAREQGEGGGEGR